MEQLWDQELAHQLQGPELGVVLDVVGCSCCELQLKILSIKCLKRKKTGQNFHI